MTKVTVTKRAKRPPENKMIGGSEADKAAAKTAAGATAVARAAKTAAGATTTVAQSLGPNQALVRINPNRSIQGYGEAGEEVVMPLHLAQSYQRAGHVTIIRKE